MVEVQTCLCGEDDCDYMAFGYPYCRSCAEHHRPPECPIDEQGRSLDPDGNVWPDQTDEAKAKRDDMEDVQRRIDAAAGRRLGEGTTHE